MTISEATISSVATSPVRRLPELDAVRGLAALAVVLYHYSLRVSEIYPDEPATLGAFGEASLFSWGHYGVQAFFIISGFVIGLTLSRARSTVDFAINRVARLYPLYWAGVLLTAGGVALFGLPSRGVAASDVAINLTMVQEHLGVDHVDGVYWSLTVELSFYILAAVAWRVGLLREGRLGGTLAAWLTISVALGLVGDSLGGIGSALSTIFVAPYAHLFVAGMLLQAYRRSRSEHKGGDRYLLALVAVPVVEAVHSSATSALIIAAITAAVALVVAAPPRFMANRSLVWLGGISYALYLIHQNLGYIALRWLNDRVDATLAVLIVLCCAIGVAGVLTRLVERPGSAWLKARLRSLLARP